MAEEEEVLHRSVQSPDHRIAEEEIAGGGRSLSHSGSSSRLNARAPEFVPRAAPPPPPSMTMTHNPTAVAAVAGPRVMKIHQHGHSHAVAAPPIHVYHTSARPAFVASVPSHGAFDYYGGRGFVEPETGHLAPASPARDTHWGEVAQKVTKQVEYYFSDLNLATTELLMKFISRDPDGFVPLSVIANFRKVKALIHSNADLASALRTSTKLVVSEDDMQVRRRQQFTEAYVEELQSRIVVAENLPEDHCYLNLMRIFSVVGSVKTIRTCYPQTTTSNGTATQNNKFGKLDIFGNKLHAFVEYETVNYAEKAVAQLNDESNWRSGLRVELLPKYTNKRIAANSRMSKGGGHEGGEREDDDASTFDKPTVDFSEPPSDMSPDHEGDEGNDKEGGGGGGRRGRGRGRGTRARGRTYNHVSNNSRLGVGHHPVSTPPSAAGQHIIHPEQPPPGVAKQPHGPRMPDGTKGFAMGRGKARPAPAAADTGSS